MSDCITIDEKTGVIVKETAVSVIVRVLSFDVDISLPFPVNARDLYGELKVTGDFSTWARYQINRLQLVEGRDYILLLKVQEQDANSKEEPPSTPKRRGKAPGAKKGVKKDAQTAWGGSNKVDFYFTINSAKHICLIGKTDESHKCRQALIDLDDKVARGGLKAGAIIGAPELKRTEALMEAKTLLEITMEISDLFGVPKHLAQILATKEVRTMTGIDFAPHLLLAPAQKTVLPEEMMLEPTEIGQVLGIGSPIVVNKWLESLGYQVKKGKIWEATEAGEPYRANHPWSKNGKSGYNLKWNIEHLKGLVRRS